MLTFEDLRCRLLDNLRARVRNGELTERRLARVTGISQPHIHNLLKGVRALTPELGDQILTTLQISLSEFIENAAHQARDLPMQVGCTCRYVNLLDGRIGPSHPWPSQISGAERVKLTDPRTLHIVNPVAVRAGEDTRMAGTFSTNDVAVLDQSLTSRTDVDPDGLYLIKNGNSGLIRRARMTTAALYVFSEDCRSRPSTWQRIQLTSTPVAHALRARVVFPTIEDHWAGRLADATSR